MFAVFELRNSIREAYNELFYLPKDTDAAISHLYAVMDDVEIAINKFKEDDYESQKRTLEEAYCPEW
jgi:hypothetical protein